MVKIFPDIASLNNFAAETFIEIANEAIKNRGLFTVSLAGGSTPKSLYRLLTSENFKSKLHWKSVYFFFGDERLVLPDDEESNFRMAKENLFMPLDIEKDKIYEWETGIEIPEKIAGEYAESVEYFFRGFPKFDLILLGMGADGHTASLFPYTEALHETQRYAVANWVEKLQTTRLTFTFPTINNAANVMCLVSGAEKAEALREVLQGDYQPDEFPAQKVKPNDGNLFWLVDAKAARLLQ